MGTSVHMIEWHYGTLLDGAGAGIAARLDAFEVSSSETHRIASRAEMFFGGVDDVAQIFDVMLRKRLH